MWINGVMHSSGRFGFISTGNSQKWPVLMVEHLLMTQKVAGLYLGWSASR